MKKEFKPLNIAVIGTICWDKIIHPDRKATEGFGGIVYTIFTLASLLESKVKITPVCLVGKDRYQEAMQLLEKISEINIRGIQAVEGKNNAVTLTYLGDQVRTEVLEGGVPVLKFERIKPFLKVDYIIVNFISGWDIELDALQKIRQHSQAKIYLDVHSLTLGIDEKGKRFSEKPVDWEKYVHCSDYLQLNQTELETILEKKLTLGEIERASSKLLDLGPEVVLVTLEGKGCHLAYKSGQGKISRRIPANPVTCTKDTTGCGDVFGAGFLAKYISSADLLQAADFANYVGGLKANFSGLEGLRYFTPLDLEFT